MARALTTISARMVFAVLLIHAVLLPVLFYGLLSAAKDSQEQAFIDHTRIYARMFADLLQVDINDPEAEIVQHLDSAILGGRSIYAALRLGDRMILSSLMEPDDVDLFAEDFVIGEHGDNVYYVSIPLELGDSVATLRLGFDEESTAIQIESARQTLIYILLSYLLVSVVLVMLLSAVVTRPLQRLRRDSREIASGDYEKRLLVVSKIHEIRELTRDLETMRSSLVGVNAQLQKEIVEREAAVAEQLSLEARLHHSQRLESIGTLAGGVAHEFNNVLLPLMLYTDISLEDLPDDSPIRANLERVLMLANRAKGLSQKILTFGRQSDNTGRVALDIAPVVEEAMSMVRALIPASIEVRTEIEQNTGTVLCNANEIQQLVVNLCRNAYDSLSTGGGHIIVSVAKCNVGQEFTEKHPRLREGEYVRLQVSDTGEGMDSATLERIFEPFFTTREVGKGTGLGLSVVHGIVVKYDGEIVVSSEPKNGATFDVYFPLAGMQALSAKEESET